MKKKLEWCSVCQSKFDLDTEGGTLGEFGVLPVAFCPTCLSCMHDMVKQQDSSEDLSYQGKLKRMIKIIKKETREHDIFKVVDEAQRRLNGK